MYKKRLIITFLIIAAIFLIGIFVRLEHVRLPGIPAESKEFYQDQDGLPYMNDPDSYYNYRLTENFLDHGYLGDTKISDIEWDMHSYYPPGVPMEYPPLIVWVAAYIYKFINLFTDVPLLRVCFWIPVFIGPMAGIIAYFFTRRFINQWGAMITGILTVTSPLYVRRTIPGFFDTDMFILVFLLSIIWLYIEAVQSENIKKRVILGVSSASLMFVFTLAWSGWYYLFYLILMFSTGYLIFCRIKKRSIKDIGYAIITFTVSFLLISIAATGTSNIYKVIYEPIVMIKMSAGNPWAPWPDVYSYVGELKTSSVVVVLLSSSFASFTGIIGIIYMLRVITNQELRAWFNKITWFFYSFLFIWVLTSAVIPVVGGIRFAMLFIPPIAISAGIMFGILIEYPEFLKHSGKSDIFNRRRTLLKIISVSVILLVILSSVYDVWRFISGIKSPVVNDDLWDASEWIKNNTKESTVVISRWGYGHLFTAIAERPVTLDGRMGYAETLSLRENNPAFKYGIKSPGISREYWINRAFTTNNEELSYGILSMLATTGDSACLTLDNYTKDTARSAEILNNILGKDKKTSIDILTDNYYLSREQAEEIVNLTHPAKTTPFVLVTNDKMGENASYIFNFGEWNLYENSSQEYLYSSGSYSIEDNVLKSDNNIEMNMKTWESKWEGKPPHCVEVFSEDKSDIRYTDSSSDFCIFILTDNEKAAVIDRNFYDSIFVKLFLEKTGTEHLEPVYKNQSVTVWQ